ncbi:MAG: hypothetical protein BTN85_2205 [Candidatus Methanohalarchaeum thermophilum]|uniref:Uncharacterized protein n=1 Tax=Methanohalarchaeum thermophilum TaxID=1903181 RepID=A0A1Q6DRX5_METT1|nr:MAG: hypothetical protein BTN85_2205 [Candidatus Methanohalarchaeum thermophilum]
MTETRQKMTAIKQKQQKNQKTKTKSKKDRDALATDVKSNSDDDVDGNGGSWPPEATDPCYRCNRDISEIGLGAVIEVKKTMNYEIKICKDCLEGLESFLKIRKIQQELKR